MLLAGGGEADWAGGPDDSGRMLSSGRKGPAHELADGPGICSMQHVAKICKMHGVRWMALATSII